MLVLGSGYTVTLELDEGIVGSLEISGCCGRSDCGCCGCDLCGCGCD